MQIVFYALYKIEKRICICVKHIENIMNIKCYCAVQLYVYCLKMQLF